MSSARRTGSCSGTSRADTQIGMRLVRAATAAPRTSGRGQVAVGGGVVLAQDQHVEPGPVSPLAHLQAGGVQPLRLRRFESRSPHVESDHREHRTRSNSLALRSASLCAPLGPLGRAGASLRAGFAHPGVTSSSGSALAGCAFRSPVIQPELSLRAWAGRECRPFAARPHPLPSPRGNHARRRDRLHRPQPDRAGRQGFAGRRPTRRPGRHHRHRRPGEGAGARSQPGRGPDHGLWPARR